MADIVAAVLQNKLAAGGGKFDTVALLNIFRTGTSAGGVGPKILVSEHKTSGRLVAGDLVFSDDYEHYLVKLHVQEGQSYNREIIEFIYSEMAKASGITMMPPRLIDDRHFATTRFDRQNGRKIHTLTATGISGLDYQDPGVSSYENLFDLAIHLHLPHQDIEELFRRMVFNLVFANHDDHLKNHSFCYDDSQDLWTLAPAYDLTFSLNPEIVFTRVSRALSINGKRTGIDTNDLMLLADRYTAATQSGLFRMWSAQCRTGREYLKSLKFRTEPGLQFNDSSGSSRRARQMWRMQ